MKLSTRFGSFGGVFAPEVLVPALEELERAFLDAREDPLFQSELTELLAHYAGRPTPLYRCRRLFGDVPTQVFLKREDLLHGGAHKTNQALAQALLAVRMGKRRLIAETGAGQHGVATAMAGALFGLETCIFMGATDVERQSANVSRMRLMGAEVVPVDHGAASLKDAINEALRDWSSTYDSTHYLIGTVTGPHPFPTIVCEYQQVIGIEAREQILAELGRLPDAVIACVGGGSNAMGIFSAFLEDSEVELIGVEAAGRGLETGQHGASIQRGRPGILHGARTLVLQDEDGQILDAHSVSAGLDYPGVGPQHAQLATNGRARYVGATDEEALSAFHALSRQEGIIPALESAHAVAHAIRRAHDARGRKVEALLVNLSGRGDKDIELVQRVSEGGGAHGNSRS